MLPCVSGTALGFPVVPDVYSSEATSSRPTSGNSSCAGAAARRQARSSDSFASSSRHSGAPSRSSARFAVVNNSFGCACASTAPR